MTPAELESLRRLLEAHRPADAVEERHLQRIRVCAYTNSDPFDRRLWPGHLTGSAFVLSHGRVLLTHHRKLGLWVQLGGHAEGERDAAAVALREAREESGLSDLAFHPALRFPDGAPRLLDVDVHAIPARGEEPAHEHLDLRFLLVSAHPERVRCDPAESRALEWVALDEAGRRGDAGMRRALARIGAVLTGPAGPPAA